MRLERISAPAQFDELFSLAEQNRLERSHYAAPFYVYYHRLRQIQANQNYAWFLFYAESGPVGYCVLYADPERIHNAITVYDIYMRENHRRQGAFRLLFETLYEMSRRHGYEKIRWDSDLPPEVWEHICKVRPKVQYLYTIDAQDWRNANA